MVRQRSFLPGALLFVVGVFVPLIGHILDTILIFRDEHTPVGRVLWIAVVWAFPFVGPLLYLLFGHRPRHVQQFAPPVY